MASMYDTFILKKTKGGKIQKIYSRSNTQTKKGVTAAPFGL